MTQLDPSTPWFPKERDFEKTLKSGHISYQEEAHISHIQDLIGETEGIDDIQVTLVTHLLVYS